MAKAKRKGRNAARQLGGLDPIQERRVRPPDPARIARALEELRHDVRRVTDGERAVRVAARNAAALFHADEQCCAVITPGVAEADLLAWSGPADAWDRALLAEFARGTQRDVPADVALTRLRRRRRAWGVMALKWTRGEADWDVRHAFTRFGRALNDVVAQVDRDRITEVRARIDRKVMEQLRSRDLFYQILDGLRSLTRYDHSAALLTGETDDGFLEIAAEKLTWRRGKSARVGKRVQIRQHGFSDLLERGVAGFRRTGAGFSAWDDGPVYPWIEALTAEPSSAAGDEPPVGDLLVAPLSIKDGLRAVLVVSAIHPGTLGAYEAELVISFLPQVCIALQNSRKTEALEAKMLETERKHAMADLARGVAHDVNNALGAVVPLVQQVRSEIAEGTVDLTTLADDLAQIDRSVRVCRDIFGGMLRFARTAARPSGTGCLRSATQMCLMILGDNLKRHAIAVSNAVPDDLPKVRLNQSELQQLVLNLVSNARDALLRRGGRLGVVARLEDDLVVFEVSDDGCGIAAEHLARVQDPFFTTKETGNGLGLSICRSLVWRGQGELEIRSAEGEGTQVTVRLPVHRDTDEPSAPPLETGGGS